MADNVTPIRIDVADAELEDLHSRLRNTRWPEREAVDDWSQGVPLEYLQELCRYWAEEYDWRRTEARLNALPQFRTLIDGLGFHFLHVPSSHSKALPPVLTHGWPGSIVEFLRSSGRLQTRPRTATTPRTHSTSCAPRSRASGSVTNRPGRVGGSSGSPPVGRCSWPASATSGTARREAIGEPASAAALVGQRDREHVVGIHLTPPLVPPDPATMDDLTERERLALASLEHAAE